MFVIKDTVDQYVDLSSYVNDLDDTLRTSVWENTPYRFDRQLRSVFGTMFEPNIDDRLISSLNQYIRNDIIGFRFVNLPKY